MLSIHDVARQLGKTESGIRKLIASKRIRYFQDGKHGRIRFKPEWVEEYIPKNTVAPRDDDTTSNNTVAIIQSPRQAKRQPGGDDDNRHGIRWDLMGG